MEKKMGEKVEDTHTRGNKAENFNRRCSEYITNKKEIFCGVINF